MLPLDVSPICTITDYPHTPTPTLHFPPVLSPPLSSTAGTTTSMTSSHSQTTSGPSSMVKPPPDPIVIFELNQPRRAKVTKEVETLRTGTCRSVPDVRNLFFVKRTHSSFSETTMQRSLSGHPWAGWKNLSRRGSSIAR